MTTIVLCSSLEAFFVLLSVTPPDAINMVKAGVCRIGAYLCATAFRRNQRVEEPAPGLVRYENSIKRSGPIRTSWQILPGMASEPHSSCFVSLQNC